MKLPTDLMREAMDRARKGAPGGNSLLALESAIATAGAEGAVDATVIQGAKVLLATQSLRTAMEQRDVAGLRVAITVAEGEEEANRAIIEVSGLIIGD